MKFKDIDIEKIVAIENKSVTTAIVYMDDNKKCRINVFNRNKDDDNLIMEIIDNYHFSKANKGQDFDLFLNLPHLDLAEYIITWPGIKRNKVNGFFIDSVNMGSIVAIDVYYDNLKEILENKYINKDFRNKILFKLYDFSDNRVAQALNMEPDKEFVKEIVNNLLDDEKLYFKLKGIEL